MIPNGAVIGGYHTFRDLHMIPKHKLIAAPAKPKFITFDIPGIDGAVDLTSLLAGASNAKPPEGDFEGEWDFRLIGDDYIQDYTNCLGLFNGEIRQCVLDDLPGTTYEGRLAVAAWKSYEGYSDLTVAYHFDNAQEGAGDLWLLEG